MKVILVSYAGSVDLCIVVNNGEEEEVIEKLEEADSTNESSIRSITPDTLGGALDYMRGR